MAWKSLRGKCWMDSGISNLKRAVSRATDSADFLQFTQQQYWLTANLLASDKTQLFYITSYRLLVRKMATCKWHIPLLRASLLHLAGAELDSTNSLLNSVGYL